MKISWIPIVVAIIIIAISVYIGTLIKKDVVVHETVPVTVYVDSLVYVDVPVKTEYIKLVVRDTVYRVTTFNLDTTSFVGVTIIDNDNNKYRTSTSLHTRLRFEAEPINRFRYINYSLSPIKINVKENVIYKERIYEKYIDKNFWTLGTVIYQSQNAGLGVMFGWKAFGAGVGIIYNSKPAYLIGFQHRF